MLLGIRLADLPMPGAVVLDLPEQDVLRLGILQAAHRQVFLRRPGARIADRDAVERDMVKGVVGTLCGFIPMLLLEEVGTDTTLLLRVLCGTAAMLGHMFPVYLKFKGGKGVSTALGLLFGVAPFAGLLGFAGWGIFFGLSRYVSLASCLAAVIVGGLMWSPLYAARPLWFAILITILALLAIVKHRTNLVRLCKGTENRFAFTAKQRAIRDAKRM